MPSQNKAHTWNSGLVFHVLDALINVGVRARHAFCKRYIRTALSGLLLLGLAGCMQVETLVKVNADGSGEVVETMIMGEQLVAMTRQMAKGSEDNSANAQLFDEQELRERVSKMGTGVSFVGVDTVKSDSGEGYRATYAFEDIRTLRIQQSPGEGAKMAASSSDDKKSTSKPLTFDFIEGSPSKLVINVPQGGNGPKGTAEQATSSEPAPNMEAAASMMKEMFKGMRMFVALEVDGKIQDTNASFVDGQRITLIDVEFDKLITDPEKLNILAASEGQDVDAVKELLSGVQGLRAELESRVQIEFGAMTSKAAPAESAAAVAVGAPAKDKVSSAPMAPKTMIPEKVIPKKTMPATPTSEPAKLLPGQVVGMQRRARIVGRYAWQPLDMSRLPQNINAFLRVKTSDGKITKGAVRAANRDAITLRQSSIDGGGEIQLARENIELVEIYRRK